MRYKISVLTTNAEGCGIIFETLESAAACMATLDYAENIGWAAMWSQEAPGKEWVIDKAWKNRLMS
jgi:hypothetical protein